MNEWRTPIRCYVSPAGNSKIAQWYEGLSVQEKAYTDEFLKDMRRTRAWSLPSYRPKLQGYKGLGELRWDTGNKKHRLVGFFHDGYWIALLGCTHKQNIYDPADALNTADKRKKEVTQGTVSVVDYDL